MTTTPKQPVAVCTDCITYSFSVADINTPCTVPRGPNICQGRYIDARAALNWKPCSACGGTGRLEISPCLACQASGWLLTRRR